MGNIVGNIIGFLKTNETTDSVDHNFIHTYKFEDLSRDKLQAISSNPTFKVLKIVNCQSVTELLIFLQTQNFAEIFRETLNFFFIDVSVSNEFNGLTEADLDIWNQIFPETRPWILQISPCGFDPIIYYREKNQGERTTTFCMVDKVEITSPQLKELKKSCNLSLLLQALRLNTYGDFSWQNNVLDIKLKKNKDRYELTNISAAHNSLCSRFLKLFEETLDDNQWLERVLAVLKCKEVSSLQAFLDHPFTVTDRELRMIDEQLFRVDFQNKNLLMIATETNNVEAVKYLLRLGFNLDAYETDNRTAVDIAWDKKFYGCFAAIVEADSKFPRCFSPNKPFDVNKIEIPCEADRDAIKKTLNEKENFLTNVREGNLKAVKKFVDSNPRMKKCFSTSNKTALTVALEHQQIDIYSHLRSEGFSEENDPYFFKAYEKLKGWQKNGIRDANMKLFNRVDRPHLAQLLSKSRISFGTKTRKNCYQIIAKIFSALNEVDEVSAIMKLISSSEFFEIVFDFNSDNVRDMDPSSSENTLGKSYFKKGYIYVGVLDHETNFRDILGILAHEMGHLAMYLVYDNCCLPFRNDEVRRKDFEDVFDDTFKIYQENLEANLTTETIISSVFICCNENNMSEGDRSNVKLAELIVRVPHVLAQYKDNQEDKKKTQKDNKKKLGNLKRDFCSLFNYYRDFVHEDIIKQCKKNVEKNLIKEINSLDPLLTSIRINGIRLITPKVIEASEDNKIRILSSNLPELTLTSIYQSCLVADIKNIIESSHIFLSVESFGIQEVCEKLNIALKSQTLPDLIIDCSNKVKRFEEVLKVLKKFLKEVKEKQRITLIMSQKESLILKRELFEEETPFCLIEVKHSWHELSDGVKNSWIHTEINFQGISIKCSELLEVSSKVLGDFPLSDVIKGNSIEVGKVLNDTSHKFYFPMNFSHRIEDNSEEEDEEDSEEEDEEDSEEEDEEDSEEEDEEDSEEEDEEDDEEVTGDTSTHKTFKHMIDIGKSEKVVIISGQPGSGKSSVLYKVALALKGQNPRSWVSLVDLKQNIKSFDSWLKKNGENVESFEKFFIETVLAKEELFGQEIFKSLLSSGKAFILLDGFDEISPNFKELILKFISSFKVTSGNQLWVTSRSHLENDLEKALKCKSFHFVPLTKEDQIDFLARSFEHSENSSEEEELQLRQKARDLIEKLSERLKLGSRSIGLPMLLQMLAAAYDGKPLKQNENVNLASIYETFIDDIIERWMNKGELYKQDHKQITMKSADIFELHSKIAIKHIFDSHSLFVSRNNIEYNKVLWNRERLARVGIVHFNSYNERPQFSHQTFAEYLVARFIFEGFKEFDESKVLALETFFSMIIDLDSSMIPTFLNEMLQGFKFEPSIPKRFADAFNKALESNERVPILYYALNDSLHNLVSFILETVNDEILVKILSVEDSFNRRNALSRGAEVGDDKMILVICDAIQRLNSSSDRKKIFLAEGSGESVLHSAAKNRNNESALQTVWDQMKSLLTEQEKKDFLMHSNDDDRNLFHFAFRAGEKTIRDSFTLMTNLLTKLQIQELLFSKDLDGDLPIHFGLEENSAENLKVLCEKVKEAFTTEEIGFDSEGCRKLFRGQPNNEGNIFRRILENDENSGVLTFFWNWLQAENIFSLEELKTFLKVGSKYFGYNLLHASIQWNNSEVTQELLQIIIKNFNKVERKSFMFDTEHNYNQNALQLAINEPDSKHLDVLLSNLNDLLEQEDVKLLLMSIFHSAALSLNCFFSLHLGIKKNKVFSDIEMNEILARKDSENRNFLHLIGRNENLINGNTNRDSIETFFKKLIELLETNFKPLDIQTLLRARDNDGYTCLLLAVSERDQHVIEHCFKLVKHFITDPNERKLYFMKCCNKNRNIIQCAASNSGNIFSFVETQLVEVLKPKEIKTLLLHQSDDGSSMLHEYFEQDLKQLGSTTLNVFFDVVERYLNQDEIETLLISAHLRT